MPAPDFIDGLYRDSIKGGIGYFFPSVSFQSLGREERHSQDSAEETGVRSVVVNWLGSRYSLARDEPFTQSELKLLRSIEAVSDSRYRMIVDATSVEQRVELFRGLPEDRYVSAYLARPCPIYRACVDGAGSITGCYRGPSDKFAQHVRKPTYLNWRASGWKNSRPLSRATGQSCWCAALLFSTDFHTQLLSSV